jgi:hypothetical protein
MEGKPVRFATRADQLGFARKLKEAGIQAKMDVRQMVCRATATFGWCAVDYDFSGMGPAGKPMYMSFRGTGVGVRAAEGWKTIHWHESPAKLPGPPPLAMRAVNPKDLTWKELPGTGGVKMAAVFEDPGTKGIAAFVQMPKRWKGVADHFHRANIHYTVLKGIHAHVEPDGDRRETREGGWGLEVAKNIHRTEGKNGLLLFIVTDAPFDVVMVDKQGNPLPAERPAAGKEKAPAKTADKAGEGGE